MNSRHKHPAALLTGRFFPDLESRFVRFIRERKDALSTVWVLAPTGSLQRRLRQQIAQNGGALNIHFFGFESLAEQLALSSPAMSKNRVLPPGGDLLLVEEIVAQEKTLGYFDPSREEPRFAAALLSSLRDLKDAGISAEEFAKSSLGIGTRDKLVSFAQLYASFERKLRERNLIDRSDLVSVAIESLQKKQIQLPVDLQFLVYGVYDFTGLQRELLRALIGHAAQTQVFFPPEANYSKPALSFFRECCVEAGEGIAKAKGQQLLPLESSAQVVRISAAGEGEELRELLREVQALDRAGVPLDEIGVVARNAGKYDRWIREQFEKATIPLASAKGVPLSRFGAARSLLLMLQIDPELPTRRSVLSWLSLPQVNLNSFAGTAEPSTFFWDFLFREAAISRFEPGWEKKLKSLPEEHRESVERAAVAVGKFLKLIRSIPASSSPSKMATELKGIVESHLVGSEREAMLEAIDRLAQLDLVCDRIERAKLSEILRRIFDESVTQERVPGVFWGDALAARGLSFRHLFILGMEEKEFPSLPRLDPILLDEERFEIARRCPSGYLQTKSRSRYEEEYLFQLLQEAAREKLFLLRSRLDPITGRETPASIFWRDEKPKTEQSAPLKFWSNAARGEPTSALELDLRVLDSIRRSSRELSRNYLESISPANIAKGFRLEAERWKFGKISSFDGAIDPALLESLPGLQFSSTVYPTRLESLARCPFQFFLNQGLKVNDLERPEDEEELDSQTLGILIHKTLAALFKSLDRKKKLADYTPEFLNTRLDEIFAAVWKEQERAGIPGSWADREANRVEALENLKRYVQSQREDYPVPAEMEWVIPAGTRFSTGKHSFELGGRVDRIDLEGETARVVDFKSGKIKGHVGCIDGGKRLQVPIYAHAVAAHFKKEKIAGEYHYLRDGKTATPLFLGEAPEVKGAVESILHLAERGLFLQTPEKGDYGNCGYCEYKLVCAGEQHPVFERKRSDGRVAEFLKVRLEEPCPSKAAKEESKAAKPRKGKKS